MAGVWRNTSSITHNGAAARPSGNAVRLFAYLFCLYACLAGCKSMAQPPVSPVPTPADAAPEMTVYVQRDGTPMYDGAGTAYDIMDTFACGQEAIRLSEEGGWTQVRIDGQVGYISHENLSDTQVWPTMPQAFTNPRIVIYKSRRVLMLYDGDRCYGRYAVALGWAPVGDKREEGDGKTPEGTYYVCYRNANSSFYRSLGLSYPNEADAARGLREGLIDQETYARIARAIEDRRQPPWNTALGGEIMIHGGGIESDWTAGCVALTDADMDVLWTMCPMGTVVFHNKRLCYHLLSAFISILRPSGFLLRLYAI